MVRSRAVSKPIITTLATPMSSRRTIQLSGVAAQKPLLLPFAMEVRLSISETISVLKPLVCSMLVPLFLPLSLGPTAKKKGLLVCCTGYASGGVRHFALVPTRYLLSIRFFTMFCDSSGDAPHICNNEPQMALNSVSFLACRKLTIESRSPLMPLL